jgi:hypothetical protein
MTLRADYNADAACLETRTSANLFRDSAELISYHQIVSVPETPLAHAQYSVGHSPTISLLQGSAKIVIASSSPS